MNQNLDPSSEREQQPPEDQSKKSQSVQLSARQESILDAVLNLLNKAKAASARKLPLTRLQDLLQTWNETVSQVWFYQKHGEGWHQYVRIEHFTSKEKSAYKVSVVAFDELDFEMWESFDFDTAE